MHELRSAGATAEHAWTVEENCPIPYWRGEPLEGKTILLYGELGLGDEILSLRFAKPVKDMGARVIISARPSIVRLASSLASADAVIPQYGPASYDYVEVLQYDPPPWKPDYVCAQLTVPMFAAAGLACTWPADSPTSLPVGMDAETLPCRDKYLRAEDRNFGMRLPEGLNVGICWATGKSNVEFAGRKSLSLRQLAPLARDGVNLVSLQQMHDDHAELRALGVIDIMPGMADFADTARIIDRLDLVVTVDTAVAHLAGALGKPVWNLVRFDAVWPWFWETDATCWYDSMTLYRQSRENDWEEPLNRMFADFDRWLSSHGGSAECGRAEEAAN